MAIMKINLVLIRLIGVIQILGGLLGLTLTFRQGFGFVFNYFIYFIIITFAFSFGIYCGVILLTKNISRGINLSIINQFLQVVQFSILGNGIEYVAGIYFAIGFSDTPSFNLQYKFSTYKSSCFLSFMTGDEEIKVMINLIAILFIVYLYKVYSKFEKDLTVKE